jgi:hypothetical protein
MLFLSGIILCESSISGAAFSRREIPTLLIGITLLMIPLILGLPAISCHSGRLEKLEKISRYLIQSLMWGFLALFVVEGMLRVIVRNPPLYRDVTNWVGDIPSVHSVVLWGKEGYAITQ